MELFFIPSSIGLLQALIKEDKLYSLSQVKNHAKTRAKQDNKKINYKNISNKNLSYLIDDKDFCIFKQKKNSALAKNIKQQLALYFKGNLKKFKIPIYNRGTDFQKKVWQALQKIPWGHTKKYSQIAKELNQPKAYRAVGNSCAKNPFLIVVPCHRVVSHSGLGGFALGLKAKQHLLRLENQK